MSDRGLTDEMVQHVRDLVESSIKKHYPVPEGQKTNPGGQRKIADDMHVSQAWLNQFRLKKKSVDIDTLLALRAYFLEKGEPLSIEQMLGIEPLVPVSSVQMAQFKESLARLEAQVEGLREAKEREPRRDPFRNRGTKADKALETIRRKRWAVMGTEHAKSEAEKAAPTKSDVAPKRRRKASGDVG